MDNVEPIELITEGVEDTLESVLDTDRMTHGDLNPDKVQLNIVYKSGAKSEIILNLPIESPIYSVPLDYYAFLELIMSSYSFGESPVLALPFEGGSYMFLDLNSTDFMELVVIDDDVEPSTDNPE